MSSLWPKAVAACLVRELRTELRTRHGLFTALLFGVLAVVAASFVSFTGRPDANEAAGLLCVTLLFAAVSTLPRLFLAEEDQGTWDLSRTLATSEAIFVGKAFAACVSMVLSSLLLGVLFVGLTGVRPSVPGLFIAGLLALALALGFGISLCGALAMGGRNRWMLVATLSMPLMMPTLVLGIGVLRVAFGEGSTAGAWQSLAALLGFATVLAALGPSLASAVWRVESGNSA